MERKPIGMVAEEAGVAASTIRYYERIGLLPEPERESGRRKYAASISGKLRLIRSAKQAGFALGEIRVLVNGFPPHTPPAERWQALSKERIAALSRQIALLRRMKSALENTLHCHCATLEECASQGCDADKGRFTLCCASLPVRSSTRHP